MEHIDIVLEKLDMGLKQKEIAKELDLTENVIKKISQLRNLYEDLDKLGLDNIQMSKVKHLGFKALGLKKLISIEYKEGLVEILNVVDISTNRNRINNIVKEIIHKQNELKEITNNAMSKQNELKEIENKIKLIEDKFRKIQEQMDNIDFLKLITDKTMKLFLVKHLTYHNDEIVLKHRLDSEWQYNLKAKRILIYKSNVWTIRKLDDFMNQLKERIEEKLSIRWETSEMFGGNDYCWNEYDVKLLANNSEYKLPQALNELFPFVGRYEVILGELKELKKQRNSFKKEIKELKTMSVSSYKQNILVANELSKNDIKNHRLVQDAYLKYMRDEGYVACSEISKDNYRFDVVCFKKELIIGEVKASRADFLQDNKCLYYKEYCNELYFVLHSSISLKQEEIEKLKRQGIGLIFVTIDSSLKGYTIEFVHKANYRNISIDIETELKYKTMRILSSKMLFGF